MAFILPGSLSVEGTIVTGALHTGSNEWDYNMDNIRYVEGDTKTMKPDDTILSFLTRIYNNSTGCLVRKTFKVN